MMKHKEIRHYDNDLHLCRPSNVSFITVETITTCKTDIVDGIEMPSYSIKRRAWLCNIPHTIKSFNSHSELIRWMQNEQKAVSA